MRTIFLPAIGLLLAGSGLALAQVGPAGGPGPSSPTAVAADSAPPAKDGADAADADPAPAKEGTASTGPAAPLSDTVLDTFACPQGACAPKCKTEVPPPCGCWWVSGDYMMRWFKHSTVAAPLLVVGGPTSSNGIAGAPGTTALGQQNNFLNFGAFSGVQMTTGFQVPDGPFGFEFGGFVLEQRTTGFAAASDPFGSPVISFPFISTTVGAQGPDRLLVAFPGAFTGSASVTSTSRMFGGEANVARSALCCGCLRGDVIAGFRYLNLSEQINAQGISEDIPPAIGTFNGFILPPNTVVTSMNTISTQNNFYGSQVGGRLEWHRGAFYVVTSGKVALGVSDQIINIGGLSSAYLPGTSGPVTALGGVYALPSNIGRTNHAEFAAVPELGVTFGFQLTQRLRIYASYSGLYWSNVVRPGDQISPLINRQQIPLSSAYAPVVQPTEPIPFIHRTDFWMQGVDIGLAFHF